MKFICSLILSTLLFFSCKRDALHPLPLPHDKIYFKQELTLNPHVQYSNYVVASHSQFMVLNTRNSYMGVSHSLVTHTWYDEYLKEVCHLDETEWNYGGVTTSANACNGNIFCYTNDYSSTALGFYKDCAIVSNVFFSYTTNPPYPRINFLKITQMGNMVFQFNDTLYCIDSLKSIHWKIPSAPLNLTTLRDVCETSSGDILLLGEKQSVATDRDFCMTRLDKNGVTVWQKLFGGAYYDEAQQIVYKNDQEIFLLGHSNSFTAGGMHDAFIVEINEAGDTIKQKTFGGMYHDGLQGGLLYRNQLVVTGYHDPDGSGREQVFVALLDSNLNVVQQADAPFTVNHRPSSCALINNNFAVCGDKFLIRFTLPY